MRTSDHHPAPAFRTAIPRDPFDHGIRVLVDQPIEQRTGAGCNMAVTLFPGTGNARDVGRRSERANESGKGGTVERRVRLLGQGGAC